MTMITSCTTCSQTITPENALVVRIREHKPAWLDEAQWAGNICALCAEKLHQEYDRQRYLTALISRGYPERHVRTVQHYHGHGVDAAKAITPHLDAGGIVGVCGDRGRGKTGMAVWIAHNRWHAGRSVGTFVTATKLLLRIRATFGGRRGGDRSGNAKRSTETEEQAVEHFTNQPLLVIDEFHERKESEFENLIFTEIMNGRYNKSLPTLILANSSRQDLIDSLGASIADRIAETGAFLECADGNKPWPSYRGEACTSDNDPQMLL